MNSMLTSVLVSGVAFATGVSVAIWRPHITFTSPCEPAAVTLLAARCLEDHFHYAPGTPAASTSKLDHAAHGTSGGLAAMSKPVGDTATPAVASSASLLPPAAHVASSRDHQVRGLRRRRGSSANGEASARSDLRRDK
jgi:hypothetical protein